MDIGDNMATLIKDTISEAANLTKELDDLRVDRREFMKSGKEKGFPMAELMALENQDDEKAEEKSERLLLAATILGKKIFSEEVDASNLKCDLSDGDLQAAKAVVQDVNRIDVEIKQTNAALSDLYKKAKADGLVVPVIKQIVNLRLNPDKAAEIKENQLVFKKYEAALEK